MKHPRFNLPIFGTVTYLGEAASPADLVAALLVAAKVSTCPGCGKRQRWMGTAQSWCARCLKERRQ